MVFLRLIAQAWQFPGTAGQAAVDETSQLPARIGGAAYTGIVLYRCGICIWFHMYDRPALAMNDSAGFDCLSV